mgnify:CR=1 FL=1
MNKITDKSVVEIDYILKNSQGNVIDTSEGEKPLSFIMGRKNIIPGLEAEISKKNIGDSFSVVISPKDAYGMRDETLVHAVPKSQFGDDVDQVQLGSQLEVETQDGEPMIVQVTELTENEIVLDGNHPMAGETLHFDIKVLGSREATNEELDRGFLVEEESKCDPQGGCC